MLLGCIADDFTGATDLANTPVPFYRPGDMALADAVGGLAGKRYG